MATARTVLTELVRRVQRHRELEALIAAEFEVVDNYRICVRRDDVVRYVADMLSTPLEQVNMSGRLRKDVRVAVRRMGGVVTRRGNKRIFRRIKRRSMSMDDAIDTSRAMLAG